MKYHLLVDGDILVYAAAFANEKAFYTLLDKDMQKVGEFSNKADLKAYLKENPELEEYSVNKGKDFKPFDNVAITLHSILKSLRDTLDVDDLEIFLTGKGNYREDLYPEYKKNRAEYAKPYWFKDTRQYLLDHLGATLVHGQEADDEMGIRQWTFEPRAKGVYPVIVSTDKDLNMIPGLHYNSRKEELFDVEPEEAMQHFYRQILTGDTVDNIPGLWKIGPVKAGKILNGYTKEKDLYAACLEAYEQQNKTEQDLHLAARLLWIRRMRDEVWEPFKYDYGCEENRKVSVQV